MNRWLEAEDARTLINPHYNVNAFNTFIHNCYAEGPELFPSAIHLHREHARIDFFLTEERNNFLLSLFILLIETLMIVKDGASWIFLIIKHYIYFKKPQ